MHGHIGDAFMNTEQTDTSRKSKATPLVVLSLACAVLSTGFYALTFPISESTRILEVGY